LEIFFIANAALTGFKGGLRAYPKIISEAPKKSGVEAFARIFSAPFWDMLLDKKNQNRALVRDSSKKIGAGGEMDKNIGRLGFGAMRLPEKGGQVDLPQTSKMVDMYLEQGFNYFDTAYVYHGGKSETVLRDALVQRHPRDKFCLATKLPIWQVKSLKDAERIFEDQLKKCGVDYFDFYLLHAMGKSREATAVNAGLYELCQRLKREGKARYTGFSFHDEPAALAELLDSHPETDFVQLQINYLDVFRGSSGKLY
jgi:predicted aldo/keto reductase-like oxidoreductase